MNQHWAISPNREDQVNSIKQYADQITCCETGEQNLAMILADKEKIN